LAESPARAQQLTDKTIQVAVRTIGFVVNPPVGSVPLAILYDPQNPESVADARTAVATLGSGLPVRAAVVTPELVPVGNLDRLRDYRFVLIMSGLQNRYDDIFEAARGRGALTISADAGCVRTGRCVMAVASEPRVEILVNQSVGRLNGVEFLAAFRMMISEM
jgi:hypothetical protein